MTRIGPAAPQSGTNSALFPEWYLGKRDGANHATDHLLPAVDCHLSMLNGQRNRRSGFDRLGLVLIAGGNAFVSSVALAEEFVECRRQTNISMAVGFEPVVGEPFPFWGPCGPHWCPPSALHRKYMFGAPRSGGNI